MTTITTSPRAETPATAGAYPAFLARISQDLLLSLPTFEYALSSLPPEPLVQSFLQSTRTLPKNNPTPPSPDLSIDASIDASIDVIPAKAGTCQSPTSPPNNNPTPPLPPRARRTRDCGPLPLGGFPRPHLPQLLELPLLPPPVPARPLLPPSRPHPPSPLPRLPPPPPLLLPPLRLLPLL
ncbi:MAG: hypothetical protein LBU08_04240, partial [Tannerellaceae bacterium]|nr:hypothetical protein [Tannerellaceae bacterium]